MSAAYIQQGDRVTLDMTINDHTQLLLLLGYAAGSISKEDGDNSPRFWRAIDLVNRLNEGNPRFTPYEIPAEFRKDQ